MPDLIIQSDLVSLGKITPPTPFYKGQVVSHLFEYTFAATFDYDLVTKLEFAVLPAFCVPVDAMLQGVTTTNVVDVGLMTGTYGDATAPDDREVGDELFDGHTLAVAGTRTINWTDILAIEPVDYARGIGLIATAANITSGHGVKLLLSYKLGPHNE